MLKALELVGFKSFADKTRFEFPKGITVVVGPNGSGKSNVVDSIKWVLGEQSAKSLRGKEMADVIFNGSGSRRALNSAETTLVFDNAENQLPIETDEVNITRRVYRSGEGEYLINNQPCRLRDIRDLFAGTGVSTQAYSIIEQGKVDVLLQSSPKDRRLIFEEAAGISRFKAKKIEAIRRLERVEQNLLRLCDIVEEVENRLRVIRKQASKARRYKEYTDRLQQLRTQVGLADWRRLTAQLGTYEKRLAELSQEAESCNARVEKLESRALEIDTEILDAEEAIRQAQSDLSENRERIAAAESTIEHQRTMAVELAKEIERLERQLDSMDTRTRDLGEQLEGTVQEVTEAEENHRHVQRRVADSERALTELTRRYDQIREESAGHRIAHTDLLRHSAELSTSISGLEARIQSLRLESEKCEQQSEQFATAETESTEQLTALRTQEMNQTELLQVCHREWKTAKEHLADLNHQQIRLQDALGELRESQSAAKERAVVLAELEQRLEGVGGGVKDLLLSSRQSQTGPLREIRGLVADVLQVGVEHASLIEVALAEQAGYLVIQSRRAVQEIVNTATEPLAGRVGFLTLENDLSAAEVSEIDLAGRPGVVERADRLVNVASEFAELNRRLLGKTWVVETLGHALALIESAGEGVRFVTLDAEWVGADQSVCIGPQHAATGIISRRSEIRALDQKIRELDLEVEQRRQHAQRLSKEIKLQEAETERQAERRSEVQESLAEVTHRARSVSERLSELKLQRVARVKELASHAEELATANGALDTASGALSQAESQLANMEARLRDDGEEMSQIEDLRQRRIREATLAKVELAKSEQRLAHLKTRLRQFEQDQQERQNAVQENRTQLDQSVDRVQEAERTVLSVEAEVAELYLRKEELAQQTVSISEGRDRVRENRAELLQEATSIRGRVRKLETEMHQQELDSGEIRHQRDTLVGRLREDYDIDLAELEHTPTEEEERQRAEVDEEISGLRRKITNIGNVNLEALDELDELEIRFTELSTQYEDLTGAKNSLESIIEKINADSRRLFIATLETVREHFKTLFRKLFGGGQADIIIEDDIDILESGLEIIARPPGKEPRSISLLSGGEKTLTCVALLLAIFRSKPSPFCVLDEVDAALDEANIERFIGVLDEFLDKSQFIIISHSKKTMTCAGTLYGVTMQESGISKRVSVQFDDVSEDGEILKTANEASDGSESADSASSETEDGDTQAA